MTKKQALNEIKATLDNINDLRSNKIKAQIILETIEHLGMLPPKVLKLVKRDVFNEQLESVHEWED